MFVENMLKVNNNNNDKLKINVSTPNCTNIPGSKSAAYKTRL